MDPDVRFHRPVDFAGAERTFGSLSHYVLKVPADQGRGRIVRPAKRSLFGGPREDDLPWMTRGDLRHPGQQTGDTVY